MLGVAGAQCPTAQVVRLQTSVVSAQPRHSKRLTKRRASSGKQAASTSDNDRESWDQITNRMVSCSSIPFSILVLPQVVQNISYMAAGNMSALSVISWEGYLSGLLGNTLLCSHFANSGEHSAMMVQIIGIANSMAILTQLALAACMPRMVFAGAVACVLLAVCMSVARLTGRIPAPAKGTGQLGVWKTWQLVSGVAGLSVVPQVLYNTMNPGTSNCLPGMMTLLALTMWYAVPANRMDKEGRPSLEQLPGLASTLLFALSPLPQLARNFLDPGSLEGLSIGTMLLAVTGNALMVPRALFVRDPLWRLGTCWACIATWTQLLSMFIRESSVTGLRYVSPPLFAAVTAVMAFYFAFVFTRNAKIQAMAK